MGDVYAVQYPKPTAQVEPFSDVLGIPLTIEFLLNFGGAEFSVSANPRGSGALETLVGRANVQRLFHNLHRLPIRAPMANVWLAQCLHVQGMSTRYIARRLRITDVTATKYVQRLGAEHSGLLGLDK